jgi:hypothetical protein
MGAAERLIQFIKGYPPLFTADLFFEFRLAFITEPTVAFWGYPEFHFVFLPFKGLNYLGSGCVNVSVHCSGGEISLFQPITKIRQEAPYSGQRLYPGKTGPVHTKSCWVVLG